VGLGPEDRCYIPLPLYHGNALAVAFSSVVTAGATAVVPERFSARAFVDDLRALLEGAGFGHIDMTSRRMRLRYPGPDAMWAAVRHVHGEYIPADRLEDARVATMAEIARVGLPLRNTGWLVSATA
jgi:hypothetical protein